MNNLKKTLIFSFLAVLSFSILFIGKSFADEKYQLILIYANWNVYSQKAISVFEEVAETSNGKYSLKTIDIDDKSSFVRINQLRLEPQPTIPCYYVLNKNNKTLYKSGYRNENAEKIMSILNSKTN
ncbi:MAG: hypothetical protein PHX18_03275 [Candidatus Gastranaerophilales bacterium]|nr:hypothetical protein [Candidatus Gastranaerophilales bacterium]